MYKIIISEGFRKQTKEQGCTNLVIRADKVRLNSVFNPEKILVHEFCGEYEFEKLNSSITKGIKRDLLALKIKQAQKAKIEFWKDNNLISREIITLHDIDSISKRVKNTALDLININNKIS